MLTTSTTTTKKEDLLMMMIAYEVFLIGMSKTNKKYNKFVNICLQESQINV